MEARFLVVLNEFRKQFKTITVRGSCCRIINHKSIDLGKISPIFVFGLDDFRLEHHKFQFVRFV